MLRVSERTIRGWESGDTRIPYAAYKLMRLLKGGKVLGPEWRDFFVYRNVLITPEGHRFEAGELAWWSLLVRRAKAFGELLRNAQQAGRENGAAATADRTANEAPPERRTLLAGGLPVCGGSNTAHLSRIDHSEAAAPHLSDAQLGTLTPKERLVLQAWESGADLRTTLPKATFYRHRRVLLAFGLDIKAAAKLGGAP